MPSQLDSDIENLKKSIVELCNAVSAAAEKQRAAQEDVKRLEKDMHEFKNNKEGKITELKVIRFLVLVLGTDCSMGYRAKSQSKRLRYRNKQSS